MTDDRMERALGRLRASYRPPPPTPREEMWEVIRAALEDSSPSVRSLHEQPRRGGPRRRPRLRWGGGLAAAAVLVVIGVGIGRMSMPEPAGVGDDVSAGASAAVGAESDPRNPDRPRSREAFRYAAVSHLLRSESLLTMVKNDAGADRFDANLGRWAGALLTDTRLLLDSPAADDPGIGALLEDLELILVQLARLSAGEGEIERNRREMELIAKGMEGRDMLLRIQAVTPAGAARAGA